MHTADLRGHTCWYETHGDAGPPVLFIMGFGFSGVAWRPIAERLAREHQGVLYDNRGLGQSTTGAGPHNLPGLADDAAALIAHLGWESAHVVGVSMGGMIAQHLALRHRERVRSLTLVATHPGPVLARRPTIKGMRLFLQANLRSGEARLEALGRLLFPEDHLRTLARDGWSSSDLAVFAVPSDKTIRLHHLRSILEHDTRTALEGLTGVSAVVIKPALDVLVPPGGSDALMRHLPRARLVTFPNAGHGVTSQHETEVATVIAEHVARVEA